MIIKGKQILLTKILFSCFLILSSFIVFRIEVNATTINFENRVLELKEKFPHGKYWNHVGMQTDNNDGYTELPCDHSKKDVDHIDETSGCTCNHFSDQGHLKATQCMGFANKLGYDVFGETSWSKIENPINPVGSIQLGDIVRINGHSVFVIGKIGNEIMVGEANYPSNCQISWDRMIDITKVKVEYIEHANNYASVIEEGLVEQNPVTPDPEETNEENVSTSTNETDEIRIPQEIEGVNGFYLLSDGLHYAYYKNGKIQKNKWIKIKRKTYYLNEEGCRATGLVDINNKTYYFNQLGVLEKEKWLKLGSDFYYVNKNGLILKSQWLYKENVLVYVKKNGAVARNEIVKIGKYKYYFKKNGKRSKGFKKYKGKYYYCDRKGIIQKNKWIQKGSKKYYLMKSGVRAENKLIKIGKYRYYFGQDGLVQKKKKIEYQGRIYRANRFGHCKFVDFCDK